jgi:hypothetical protein
MEFLNNKFITHLQNQGTLHQTTTLHSSSQNGIAERLNRTLLDHVHTMLFDSKLPKTLWPYSVAYACYLKNRSPTCALDGKTPHEMFFNSRPNISSIHIFGLDVWVLDQDQKGKLDSRSNKYKFIGLTDNTRDLLLQGGKWSYRKIEEHNFSLPT